MSGPRHLWSGDWQRDSAAVSRRLEQRGTRERGSPPVELPAGAPEPIDVAPWRARWGRLTALLRQPAVVRVAVPIALGVALLLAGGVAGLVALLGRSGSSRSSTTVARAPASTTLPGARPVMWLGMRITTVAPSGAVVQTVRSQSAGERAGLVAGDLIDAVNHRRVRQTSDITRALAGLHAGATVTIALRDGARDTTTTATLAAPPSAVR